jgi:hypothetical protein
MMGKNCLALLVGVLALGLLLYTAPVSAQSETPPDEEACVACHENLYLLHDTGKWYCLCSIEARCTYCHGGDPSATDEELAHAGMVVEPANQEAAICQDCHPQDYLSRVEKFTSLAGINTEQHPCPTALALSMSTDFSKIEPHPLLVQEPLRPWQLLGLAAVLMALLYLATFALRMPRSSAGG